jgi:hypothetical protein
MKVMRKILKKQGISHNSITALIKLFCFKPYYFGELRIACSTSKSKIRHFLAVLTDFMASDDNLSILTVFSALKRLKMRF